MGAGLSGTSSIIMEVRLLRAIHLRHRWSTFIHKQIIVYGTALSTANRLVVEAYIAYKYNLLNSLPSG